MSAQHLWVAPGDIETDVTDRVQTPKPGADGFRVQTNAEQGSAGSAEMEFDDPDKDFEPVGYNAYRILETETPDYVDPYLFAGHYGEGEDERGTYRTGVSRVVRRNVTDANAVLSRYTIRSDEDPDRPQETVSARMTWLLGTSAMDFLTLAGPIDDQYIDADTTLVPKGDLTDYTPQQILDEFAQQSGRNYYIWWDGLALQYVLVYKFDSDMHLTSDLRFSNVEADVDGETTFYLGLDTKMRKDPSRLASNITVRYANGRAFASDPVTAAEFSRLDRVVDAPLVKTGAIATQQAVRMLGQLDNEEYTVIGTVFLPAAKASQFRAGMRCEMKATHLTGMDDFVWVRLLNVTCTQISEDPTLSYALAFEGANTPPVPPCEEGDLNLAATITGDGEISFGGEPSSPIPEPIDPENANDDDSATLTGWFSTFGGGVGFHAHNAWDSDLGAAHTVTKMRIFGTAPIDLNVILDASPGAVGTTEYRTTIYHSDDGSSWTEAPYTVVSGVDPTYDPGTTHTLTLATPSSHRYWRLRFDYLADISEGFVSFSGFIFGTWQIIECE